MENRYDTYLLLVSIVPTLRTYYSKWVGTDISLLSSTDSRVGSKMYEGKSIII